MDNGRIKNGRKKRQKLKEEAADTTDWNWEEGRKQVIEGGREV